MASSPNNYSTTHEMRLVRKGSGGGRSRNRTTGSQLLQLFTCQHCRKKRRRRRSSERSKDCTEASARVEQSGINVDSNSDQQDEKINSAGDKGVRNRFELGKIRTKHLQIGSSLDRNSRKMASILKNPSVSSPSRDSDFTAAPIEITQSDNGGSTMNTRSTPSTLTVPLRTKQNGGATQRKKAEQLNPILARCAKLQNESGYGPFIFQRAELLQFTAESSTEHPDESGSSPNRKSLSESSSGSGSPYPPSANKSGKRARFNEAVDIIVDDRRSGKPMVKNSVKLKPSAEVLDTECHFRKRIQSNCDSTEIMRSRHREKIFGEARITIIPGGKRRGSTPPTLRVVIRFGDEFLRERIFVRSARGGTRLIVGAYKPEPLGDGTDYLRQFVDRYTLPHAIDVLTVTATLGAGPSGDDLVITAQLFDYENDLDYN